MKSKILFWSKTHTSNPINDRQYQELLWLNPTLSDEIKKYVDSVLFSDTPVFLKEELYDNSWIIDDTEIQKAKQILLQELEELETLTGKTKHILLVVDDCFTNKLLWVTLRRILWKEAFSKYVERVDIDYKKKSDDAYLEEKLSTNHSLIILWWSLSDVYDIDNSHYDWYLAKTIKEVGDNYHQRFLNKRFIWVCFGQQFLANIIWVANKNSSWIIATIKWPAQFSPSNCSIENLEFVNPIYSQLLKWISNNQNNWAFSSVFTRTGYVNFDLLQSGGKLWIIPLVKEEKDSGIVGWGSKNWNILWVQFHPEINLLSNIHTLKKSIKELIPENQNQEWYLSNFDIQDIIKRDIWEAFYVYALLWYIRDIKETYHKISTLFDEVPKKIEVSYDEAVQRLLDTTSRKVWYVLTRDKNIQDPACNRWWIDSIDTKWRLLMNHILDWKVNRGIDEISDILWFQSLVDLIKKHIESQKNKNYIIRDLWAGDGNTIRDLQEHIPNKEIIIYGTGDYIYFDLYSCITRKTNFTQKLPDELIILFVEKVITYFKHIDSQSTIQRVKQAISQIEFKKDDKIFRSSMTSKSTSMFECEHQSGLSNEIVSKFEEYLPILEELKEYVTHNFYTLFSSSFQKIYISSFNDLYLSDPVISKIDFQYSIRATSHIGGREYMEVISDYFHNSAKPGSIFLDNWIHQSYTSIPRIKELYDVSLDLVGSQFKFIYDTKTNYFSSVIITKDMHYPDSFFEEFLSKDSRIVSLRDAHKATFFKLEYFIRNFIIANFKNHIVFWDYNTQIIDTLKSIMDQLEKKDTSQISQTILDLINYIAITYVNQWTRYNPIDMNILNHYDIDGQKLIDIISKDVYIPSWMNIHANRKY